MRRLSLLLSSSLALTHGLRVPLPATAHARAVGVPFASAAAPSFAAAQKLRGGRSFMSGAATATPAPPQEKFRKDYAPPPYQIDSLSLNFDIHEEETLVTSTLTIVTAEATLSAETPPPMELDGEDLVLRSIELNGTPLSEGSDYALTPDGLSLLKPPAGTEPFVLKTTVSIEPHKNTQLSGLYKSSGMLCTQCEAEGFRRITYFQDRPDVMATYDVRIEADKAKYPLLLANGNEVSKGDADGGRHWASFTDPFRKPSYLFACVAGDLGGIESTFTTC